MGRTVTARTARSAAGTKRRKFAATRVAASRRATATTIREEAATAPEATGAARGTTTRRTSASRRRGVTGTTGTLSARLRPTAAALRRMIPHRLEEEVQEGDRGEWDGGRCKCGGRDGKDDDDNGDDHWVR